MDGLEKSLKGGAAAFNPVMGALKWTQLGLMALFAGELERAASCCEGMRLLGAAVIHRIKLNVGASGFCNCHACRI